MNDQIVERDSKDVLQAAEVDPSTPAMSSRGRAGIADEQLRAAARVIESELGKARTRAKALTAGKPEADG